MDNAAFKGMKGKIIDFRLRPPTEPYKGFFFKEIVFASCARGLQPVPASYMKSLEGKDGSADDAAMKLLDQEMDTAGIRIGVMNGRHSDVTPKPCHVEDKYMAEIKKKSKGRLIGLAGVNFDQPVEEIIVHLEKGIKELGMAGVCMEPGLARSAMYAEDKKLTPIYKKIAEWGVPLLFMTGPFSGPDISYTDPVHFERVSVNFPSIPIILGHGCYPYVTQAIALAFKSGALRENVYVSPDVYMFAPGGENYIKAISWLSDRFLFASAYPFSEVDVAVERNLALPIAEEALPKFMYENAARLLKL